MIRRVERALEQVATDAAQSELAELIQLLDAGPPQLQVAEVRELILARMIGIVEGRSPALVDPEQIAALVNAARFAKWEQRRLENERTSREMERSICDVGPNMR